MAKYTRGVGRSGTAWVHTNQGPTAGFRLQNIEVVTANINKELEKIKNKSAAGLVTAAAEVLADAERTPPLVPVDLGPLRQSTFTTPRKKPVTQEPYVVFGYTARYAAAVHEMMESPSGKPINWSRPGSGPKWFEASLKRNSALIVQIIARSATIT